MLKKTSTTQFSASSAHQIDDLQGRYARLKTEQRLNLVDIHDASHGGGFCELSQAMEEREEIEAALEAAECILYEKGFTPMEGIPLFDCETPEEERKLRRYFEMFPHCEAVELPQGLVE